MVLSVQDALYATSPLIMLYGRLPERRDSLVPSGLAVIRWSWETLRLLKEEGIAIRSWSVSKKGTIVR